MSENRFLGSISASSIRNLLPRSVSKKHKTNSNRTKSRHNDENIRPIDPNIAVPVLPSVLKQSLPKPSVPQTEIATQDGHHQAGIVPPSDPPVKVFARIRPSHGHELGDLDSVRKVSKDSLAIGDRKFSFDSVLDLNSNQEDVFQLVGVPLVKNALAGYNTSILAYGQTGSGKTYTMWGPPSAMVDCQLANRDQGIVPRIFQMLFDEIQQEQENSDDRQVNYQCRCSFLEIYNEEIGDLLDPTQRNLEIKDDAKHGFYVENLTEEYVTSYEDITQILVKGLSSRKVGATSTNSKSSRSHIVFTCVIESWSKGTSSCFGSSKTSRISLVDLAGLERNKLDDDGKQVVKEEKSVKKSLSQLGHLVNILAEATQVGKPEVDAYRSSRLTHLLKESLGGNVKLTVICTISSDKKSNSETLSTLRFGQRVKSIHNEPVINEISEDDVNDLSDQIRQLKEELIRAKSDINKSENYSNGQNVRRSLNQLRLSLNRSLILPRLDDDTKEEIHYSEDDVKELRLQLDHLNSSCEENNKGQFTLVEDNSDTEMASEQYGSCLEESENEESSFESYQQEHFASSFGDATTDPDLSHSIDNALRSSISIRTPRYSSAFPDPTLSESPKVGNIQRKSVTFASSHLANENTVSDSSKFDSGALQQSQRSIDHLRSSLRSSKIFSGPTESLAASLQRGLQIIDSHQQNSALNRSSLAFSFEHLALKPSPTADKVNASLQTLVEDKPSTFVCASCRKTGFTGSNEVEDSLKTWLVAVDETTKSNGSAKDTESASEQSNTRVKELENICSEQAAKIEQLNLLVEEYKLKLEQNAVIQHGTEIVQIDDADNEKKLLGWNESENEEECIKEKCEIKEVREESDYYSSINKSFETNEKEALLNEIQTLKSKLLSRTDGSQDKSYEKVRSSLLSQSMQLRKSAVFTQCNNEEELEKERERWMEMESEWICLTDELRVDLESNRRRAEKVEMELKMEKKCTEELDDALSRSVLGHARMVEHYVDLQDKYNGLVEKHRLIMQGVAEVKRAAATAAAKGHGSRFAKCLASELSSLKAERAREMEVLRKENKSLKVQLRDTAEAVHAAGEVLVRLREAEEAASMAEEKFTEASEENDKLKKQVEKLKRKHKMEMVTMKQYLAESRLPESALRPLYREDSDIAENNSSSVQHDDDEAWRAEFGAIYQDHY